eukprot:scaffold4475_cov114-Isochrysis_galbana.AAC.11
MMCGHNLVIALGSDNDRETNVSALPAPALGRGPRPRLLDAWTQGATGTLAPLVASPRLGPPGTSGALGGARLSQPNPSRVPLPLPPDTHTHSCSHGRSLILPHPTSQPLPHAASPPSSHTHNC